MMVSIYAGILDTSDKVFLFSQNTNNFVVISLYLNLLLQCAFVNVNDNHYIKLIALYLLTVQYALPDCVLKYYKHRINTPSARCIFDA